MKRHSLILFAILLTLGACTGRRDAEDASKQVVHQAIDTLLPQNFYKRLEGSIGDNPVLFHLKRTGDDWDGMYYYQKYGQWIGLLFEKDSSRNGWYCFQEYTPVGINTSSDASRKFIYLKYKDGTLSGNWTSSDGNEILPVQLKENYPQGSYRFSVGVYTDAVAAFPGKPESPEATINYNYLVAEGDNVNYKWLNKQLRQNLNLVGPDTASSWTKELRNLAVSYFRDYRKEAVHFADEKQLPAFLNYESTTEVDVRYNDNGFVIVEQMSYDYTGGAHGNWGSRLVVLDVQQQRLLSLRDVLRADSTQLQPIVEKAFREQYQLSPSDSLNTILFDNYLLPNQNFYVTPKGIGFIYNPYEVAAYVMGQIFVFVPYTELRPYLQPEFKKRMNIL